MLHPRKSFAIIDADKRRIRRQTNLKPLDDFSDLFNEEDDYDLLGIDKAHQEHFPEETLVRACKSPSL